MAIEIHQIREEYTKGALDVMSSHDNALEQFSQWFEEAMHASVSEPNAMTLATANTDGTPHARIVLLKGIEKNGLVFYTNYQSQKGQELAENPNAALVFFWDVLQRQVRIEGKVERLSPEASQQYFQSRPKGSQIGAWASPQSQVIPGRDVLEEAVKDLEEKYANQSTIPCPSYWGGYILKPKMIEFWQGRASRLHDRIRYDYTAGEWKKTRLAP